MEEADVTLAELGPNLSGPYEMLCTTFKDGRELSSNIEPEVFGYICSSYITGNDVVVIATMEKVTGNLIASYQSDHWTLTVVDPDNDTVYFMDPGMPFQPSDKECGYYVMGYMRDIIEDKDTSRFVTKWDKRGSCKYTREYLDEVRNEWADFAVKKYVKEP
ncbi:hypothetical protein ACLB2K_007397 [Fragaria x ananassa]